MKNFKTYAFSVALIPALYLGSTEARAHCFLLPDSITYGSSVNGINANNAIGIKKTPDVSDLTGGNLIMGNIIVDESFNITFTFGDASTVVVKVLKGQAISLTANAKGYTLYSITPLTAADTLNTQTDVFATGNWATQAWDEDHTVPVLGNGSAVGGYIRVQPTFTTGLPGAVVSVAISSIVDSSNTPWTTYATTQAVPEDASETPFTSSVFQSVPVVVSCSVNSTCPVIPPTTTTPPTTVSLTWTLIKQSQGAAAPAK